MRRSRVAGAAGVVAGIGLLLVVMGPALTLSQSAAPMTGFTLFAVGGLVSLLALLLGLLALRRTRAATGLSGRGLAVLAVVVGACGFVAVARPAFEARAYPPINDITTDLDDPPSFSRTPELEALSDLAYPGAAYREAQQAAYPDLGPLDLDLPPSDAFDAVLAALGELGLTITLRDPTRGRIQGFETTRIFRFVDDVTIRITPQGATSRIDIRSKSRDGQGDLGANALRIRRLQDAIRDQV